MTETQDGALVWQTAKFLELGTHGIAVFQRRLLPPPPRVRQGEQLLHEVNTQDGLQRKRWPASLAFGVIGGDEFNQRCPRNDLFICPRNTCLRVFFDVQAKVQAGLFYGLNFSQAGLTPSAQNGELCRVFLFL